MASRFPLVPLFVIAAVTAGTAVAAEDDRLPPEATASTDVIVRKSDGLLRRTARAEGLGLLGVEFPLEGGPDGWVRGKPREDRLRMAVTEIDESEIPMETALEFRGYLHAPESGFYRLNFAVSGILQVRIDGRLLAGPQASGDTRSQSHFVELEKGLHAFRVEYENHDGEGALSLRAEVASGEIVSFRVGSELTAGGTAEESRREQADENPPAGADPLVTVSRMVREAFLDPEAEGRSDGSRGRLPTEARPYRLFFEEAGDALRSCPHIYDVTTEPATGYGAFLRAGEGTGFLFLSGERRPAYPSAIPSAAFSIALPGLESRIEFPLASRMSLTGDRPYVLPLNWNVGGLTLISTTAQPLGVFEAGKEVHLVAAAPNDKEVEFTFSGADLDYQVKPWMGAQQVMVDSLTITCVPEDGGAFSVAKSGDSHLYVKVIPFSAAERASLWPHGNGHRLVDSNLEVGQPMGSEVPVRMAAGHPVRARIYPGRDVAGLRWDGTRYPAQHREDWAEVFLNPEGPLVRAIRKGDDEVQVLSFQVDESVKLLNLLIRFEGKVAEAWSGERLLGRSEGGEGWWKIPLLDDIRAGMREVRFEFPAGEGRILEARTAAVVEKMAEIVLVDDNGARTPD